MRVVVQRVRSGGVSVEGRQIAAIQDGMVILLGIGPADTEEITRTLVQKITRMRIFGDSQGKINLSIKDTGGAAIVVSQFTLYADTRKGNRPSFTDAAPPDLARQLVDYFIKCMQAEGIPTQSGEFGAHMLVQIENDGPVTIWMEA
ncbi:MAG: D-aminoacyl-tRNA deacylase [Anaerolineae bacterium]|nr:D-aminoacyl-tRNA deacylase [Anaerolineae bacterium]